VRKGVEVRRAPAESGGRTKPLRRGIQHLDTIKKVTGSKVADQLAISRQEQGRIARMGCVEGEEKKNGKTTSDEPI